MSRPITPGRAKIRILHSVGHLSRGGIEMWLYGVVCRLRFPQFEHHVMVWTVAEEAFTEEFRAAGVHVHALPSHTNPLRFAMAFRKLIASSGPFDVLHTHGTQFHGFVLALGKLAGIPVRIAHSHTDIVPVLRQSSLLYRAYAAIGHGLIRICATAGRGVSEVASVSMFGPRWRDDPRWGLLFCGVDLNSFHRPVSSDVLRASLCIPKDRFVIGHVGRFETQKNHAFLPDILGALLEEGVNAHLLLVGNGSLREAFEDEIARRGLSKYVTIEADSRDVPSLMIGGMDVFVCPSLYEGLPLVLIEAVAAGLPCLISSNIAQEAIICPDLVFRLGLEMGSRAWASAIIALPGRLPVQDRGLLEALHASPFNIDSSARSLAQLYQAEFAELAS